MEIIQNPFILYLIWQSVRNFTFLILGLIVGCNQIYDSAPVEIDRPEASRFSKQIFINNLNEPTELDVMPDGRILFIQRKGEMMLYDPKSDRLINYDLIPVHYQHEDGLMGLALDPDFDQNRWIYLYYSPVGDEPKQHLSRFLYTEKGLKDERLLLEVKTQRDECCHTGGSIQFGGDGLLYLSTGDNTNPFEADGFGPMDERVGRSNWDAQGTSSNTNDLRGKILRIKPEPNGSYSIPNGNLFVDDDPLTRPEIYIMGCRNPYRIGVDQKRGWLFWGDVGPDAKAFQESRGSIGYDEFNLAREAGYYGWPLFVGPNTAYRDYDFKSGKSGPLFDPKAPRNRSPNNTGAETLPPAIPALVYYPYAASEEFPQLGQGSRNAMAGPVYYEDEYRDEKTRFPSFFDGRVMYYDWIRSHLFFLEFSEKGVITDWYKLMPNTTFNNPIDFEFGPDGRLYFLEYGTGWFTNNQNATLSRINYIRGNRPPVIKMNVTELSGAAPLNVKFDASESFDYDQDRINYYWDINGQKFRDSILSYTFEKEGIYYPELIIRDTKGNKVREQYVVMVGNVPPVVDIKFDGNKTFFWQGRRVNYEVTIHDQEDGQLGNGIEAEKVNFDIQYYQSFDKAEVLGHQTPMLSGQQLMETLDCKSCHQQTANSVGPSFVQISNRYSKSEKNINNLVQKVINGGGGVWGEHSMAAHPDLSSEDAIKLVQYILSFKKETKYPLTGSFEIEKTTGNYFLSASYSDNGKANTNPIEGSSSVLLRSNRVDAIDYDMTNNAKVRTRPGRPSLVINIFNGTFVGFHDLDLTDIEFIDVIDFSHQTAEIMVMIDQIDGLRIGNSVVSNISGNRHRIKIEEVTGLHDVYFKFINPDSKDELFTIQYFDFIPKYGLK